jgi:hypothetical protein
VPVDVVVRHVAVELAAYGVGQPAEVEDMRRRQAEQRVVGVETHAFTDPVGERAQGLREARGFDL